MIEPKPVVVCIDRTPYERYWREHLTYDTLRALCGLDLENAKPKDSVRGFVLECRRCQRKLMALVMEDKQ